MSAQRKAASVRLLRELNRSQVLDLFREGAALSLTQIASRLNMSPPTALRIVNELYALGLVRDAGASRASRLGRPRNLLRFNGEAHAVIGMDLGGTKLLGALIDLSGVLLEEISLPSSPYQPDENYKLVCELIERLLASPQLTSRRLFGVGVGAPGITLAESGVVTWAPSLGWRDFPLKSLLHQRFGFPTFVENDVNLAALGELGFGAGKGKKNLVCIAVGTGIGSGVVINGVLYRGARQAAGEVGYLPPGVEHLGRRYEGFGALESLASGTGIAEAARCYLEEHGLSEAYPQITAEDVFRLARQGEAWAQGIVDRAVDYLALAVADVACVLDPEVIILGGGVGRSADLLVEPILRRLEGVIPYPPNLVASPLGRRAALLGAVTLVLHEVLDYSVVNAH